MDLRWSVRRKDKEYPAPHTPPERPGVDRSMPTIDERRHTAKLAMEEEIKVIIRDDIQSAVKEVLEEQKEAVRFTVEAYKRILRDVLQQEKISAQAKADSIRQAIYKHGLG